MRGRHHPRQDRMEETARLHAQGQKRVRRTMRQVFDEMPPAVREYFTASRRNGYVVTPEVKAQVEEYMKAHK